MITSPRKVTPGTSSPRGGSRPVIHAANKAEAIGQMRAYMHGHEGSVKIHKENGQIQEERTYPRSADPSHSRD